MIPMQKTERIYAHSFSSRKQNIVIFALTLRLHFLLKFTIW